MKYLIKKISVILLFVILFTNEKCSLEEEIRLDSDFVKTESRFNAKQLLRNASEYCIYIIGVSNEFDSQIAIDTATARARGHLSSEFKEIAKTNITNYLLSVNCKQDNEHFDILVNNLTNKLYEIVLYQSEVERVYEDNVSDPHTFFVVVKFDFAKLGTSLVPLFNDNVEHYIKLNPSKSMFDFKTYINSWSATNFKLKEEIVK